ncbi:MAG: 2-oxoacid:acceptor oxidoreductase family protein [Eubacteriaceae bacterium]|jgi:2-oxoglutarate ferredoxin oxidoreductase subunit gamma|nr:2-oxoacid:acceptor oxidoreductase family protein [Eubacteriaceae bacterium]
MERSLLVAGFGGQGVMLIGKNIGYTASKKDLNATFFPAYGAEMRGGTANCSVVVSDSKICSPVKQELDEIIVMNDLSYEKFAGRVKKGGALYINSSLIEAKYEGDDITTYYVPVADIARKVGNPLVANMVMLGAYVANHEDIDVESMKETIKENLHGKENLIDVNIKAFEEGINLMKGGTQ